MLGIFGFRGAAMVAFCCCAVSPEPSAAGTYVMRSCDVPGYAPAPMGPWRATPASTVVLDDNCSAGGGFMFTLPARTMPDGTRASLALATPTEGPRAVERLRIWGEARLEGSALPLHVEPSGGGLSLVSGWLSADYEPIDYAVSAKPPSIGLVLVCGDTDRPRAAATASECNSDADVPLEIRGIEVTIREDVPPTGSVIGETPSGEVPVSGVHSLAFAAADDESGVAKVEALIGDHVVGTRDLVDRCAHADWAACPLAERGTLAVDTRVVPDGGYALRLRTTDAAGNQHEESIRDIEIKNQAPPPGPEIGLLAPKASRLTASFASSKRTSVVVPLGQRVRVRGRLTGQARSGLAGAQVDVFERAASVGAREIPVGSARTRADGTYSYTLASGRTSRTVRVAYGAMSARRLRVRVRAAATLTASLRGTLLHFGGRVLSRPMPPLGKRVVLQGTAAGYAWSPIAAVRADRRGRFVGRYRLAVRRPGVRLRFRVQVPAEPGYPYLGYTGHAIGVRVR
jgi:hypothetical protein